MNKRGILAAAPVVYAAAVVGALFTNTTAFIVVACVGAMLVAALYVGFGASSRKNQKDDQQK
jgi:Flp pilus assembly protein TadB